jgi:energy-coupling factor transport system ATP-binding protein
MQKWQQQGKTVVFCSHDLAYVAKLASYAWVLNEGQLVACGPTRTIFSKLTLLQSLNLGLPELSYLYYSLKEKNVQLKSLPLTPDEAVKELETVFKARLMKVND